MEEKEAIVNLTRIVKGKAINETINTRIIVLEEGKIE
jgi:hypothetical protein